MTARLLRFRLSVAAGLLALGSVPAVAADEKTATDEMRARVAKLRMTAGADAVEPPAEPLLRYTDPARATTDGTVWAWGGPGRPAALLTLFVEPAPERVAPPGTRHWNYEFVSLADGPLRVSGGSDWEWRPKSADLRIRPLPGAPAPADDERLRARQMRLLARRFAVTERFLDESFELRLLDRPLHRYATGDARSDGALFAFSYGTNPEAVLVVETDPAGGGWRYGFARMGAAKLAARLDGAEVWSVGEHHAANDRESEPYNAFFESQPPGKGPAADPNDRP